MDVGRASQRLGEKEPTTDRTAPGAAQALARCPTCAGSLSRLDSGMRADLLLGLQRSHGNALVGGLAARAKEGACTCGGRCGSGATATVAREKKKEVKARPKDPSKPTELMSYQCDPKRTFHVEIFTAMGSDELRSHIYKAKAVLLEHNIELEIESKGISSRYYPLGYDVNVEEGDGAVTSKADACKLIAATVEDAGHTDGWMPVFYIPCDAAAFGSHAEGIHIKNADAELCEDGGSTGLTNAVMIDTRQTGYKQILLHELGHAAGIHPHTKDTFLDPAGREGEFLDAINHNQTEQLCKAPFATSA